MLSKKAQYAIYALVYLAKEVDKGPVLIRDIAIHEKLPKKFLEAILLELKNTGVVNSKKGKGGGYYLRRGPAEVTLAEIIRHFDGAIALLPCATYKYYEHCQHCKDETICGVKYYIKEIRDETVTMLKAISLQDIIDREKELEKQFKPDL
ncbi:MAG: Rrf2 family transcriptional regulator [Bacteroidales bacterium]|nr:Rrf2 family transcriptional regulator [Bacteroidales bacterium]